MTRASVSCRSGALRSTRFTPQVRGKRGCCVAVLCDSYDHFLGRWLRYTSPPPWSHCFPFHSPRQFTVYSTEWISGQDLVFAFSSGFASESRAQLESLQWSHCQFFVRPTMSTAVCLTNRSHVTRHDNPLWSLTTGSK